MSVYPGLLAVGIQSEIMPLLSSGLRILKPSVTLFNYRMYKIGASSGTNLISDWLSHIQAQAWKIFQVSAVPSVVPAGCSQVLQNQWKFCPSPVSAKEVWWCLPSICWLQDVVIFRDSWSPYVHSVIASFPYYLPGLFRNWFPRTESAHN